MKRALTDRERKFCQEVVRGMSATQAAKNAGWPTEGSAASVTATRLMKRQDILAELARLRKEGEDARAATVSGMLAKAVSTGTVSPDDATSLPHVAAGVERGFVQHALVLATQMALGQVTQARTLIIHPRPTEQNPAPKPVRFDHEVLEADPKAAAYCATLLGKEVDRVEAEAAAAEQQGSTIEGEAISPLSAALAAFYAKRGIPPPMADHDPTEEEATQ